MLNVVSQGRPQHLLLWYFSATQISTSCLSTTTKLELLVELPVP